MAKQMKGKHYKKCFSCEKKRALEDERVFVRNAQKKTLMNV